MAIDKYQHFRELGVRREDECVLLLSYYFKNDFCNLFYFVSLFVRLLAFVRQQNNKKNLETFSVCGAME